MSFLGKIEALVSTAKDELYNFYIDEEQNLAYHYSKNRRWLNKELASNNLVDSFDVTITSEDEIHLIAVNKDHSCDYYFKVEKSWTGVSILSKSMNPLLYPKIISQDGIHCLCIQPLNSTLCRLLHFKKTFDGFVKLPVADITYKEFMNPYIPFVFDSTLYVMFSSLVNGTEEIFISSFENNLNQWRNPLQITSTGIRKLYLDGVLDENQHLHMIWSDYDGHHLKVVYSKYIIEDKKLKEASIPLSKPLNCSFPHLSIYNNTLMAVWYQYNQLTNTYSKDFGSHWSEEGLVKGSKMNSFRRYVYVCNPTIKNNFIGNKVYGTIFPNIQFLGLGGEKNDEISTEL